MSLDTNVQKKKKKTTDKCVTSSSDVNESEKVQLDESIGDKSVTPESMISDSNGPETRLQSKISELKTELQETKNKNRDLQKRVKALYKEIRRLSDSILPQERVMDCLRKEKEDLAKENQNLRDSMNDLLLKLPNICKVSYNKYDDGTVVLDLRPLD